MSPFPSMLYHVYERNWWLGARSAVTSLPNSSSSVVRVFYRLWAYRNVLGSHGSFERQYKLIHILGRCCSYTHSDCQTLKSTIGRWFPLIPERQPPVFGPWSFKDTKALLFDGSPLGLTTWLSIRRETPCSSLDLCDRWREAPHLIVDDDTSVGSALRPIRAQRTRATGKGLAICDNRGNIKGLGGAAGNERGRTHHLTKFQSRGDSTG